MRTIDLNSERAFPLYGLPEGVKEVVRHVADCRQAPIDYVAAPVIAAIGVVAGKSAKVVADHKNNVNLFVGVVGDSAANKSTPAADIFAPLYSIHEEKVDAYEKAKEFRKLEEESRKGKKGATPAPATPPPTQLILTDATPEGRYEALKYNPDGLLWHRDELKALFDDFGRYNQSGEASDLLTIFDGGNITSNRKGEGLKYLKSPLLSIFGTIQPRALRATFKNTIFLDSGMVPRFVWFCPSEKPERDFTKSQLPDHGLMVWWDSFIKCIHGHDFTEPIKVTESARAILDDFRNATGNGKEGYDATIWGKLHIYAFKLSGIAAIAHGYADCFAAPVVVDDLCASWAVDCCQYFHRTALDVEGYCTKAPQGKGNIIRDLLKAYPETNKTEFAKLIGVSRRYIYQSINS